MRSQLLTSLYLFVLINSAANATQDAVKQEIDSLSQNTLSAPVAMPLPVARDGEIIDSVGSGATEAILPVIQRNDGISYITGGIGDEEMSEMKAQEPNFNVRILISSVGGEYMGDVAIRFLDKENVEILRVNSVGPFFYVNLPVGVYTVEAASPSGNIEKAKVTAPAKSPISGKVVLRFNE